MTASTDRCNFRDVSGRRCRLPRKPTHPAFCAHHSRLSPAETIQDHEALVAEVLGPSPDFQSAQAVNRTMGKLLEAFLAGRIPARHTAVAGYLCQLLIQTLPLLRAELEPEADGPPIFQFITNVPRPRHSPDPLNDQATSADPDESSAATSGATVPNSVFAREGSRP